MTETELQAAVDANAARARNVIDHVQCLTTNEAEQLSALITAFTTQMERMLPPLDRLEALRSLLSPTVGIWTVQAAMTAKGSAH